MKRLLILGYYGKSNLGDDLFQTVLTKWLDIDVGLYSLQFLNPLECVALPPADIILVGGGDLVNDYFMLKIKQLVQGFPTIPIYGIGIGFPYPNLITEDYLNIFDFIQTRTASAMPKLLEIMPNRVAWGPDLVFDLPKDPASGGRQSKSIGVFLSNSMCPAHSGLVFDKLVQFLSDIAVIGHPCYKFSPMYNLYLYSMDTSGTPSDDSNLTTKLASKINMQNVYLITEKFDSTVFSQFYATICTRFHAHVLSIHAATPFVSLFSTEKVADLLATYGLVDYGERMQVESDTLIPNDFNVDSAFKKFLKMCANHNTIKTQIGTLHNIPTSYNNCVNLLPSPWLTKIEYVKQLIENLIYYEPKKFSDGNITPFMVKIAKYLGLKSKDLDSFVVTKQNSVMVSKIITFAISRCINQSYTWGLEQNLLSGQKIAVAVKWIVLNTVFQRPWLYSIVPIKNRKFNLAYFDQNLLHGMHRSGWQYVVDNLKMYHNPDGIIFDSYLDKTFGWDKDFYVKIGLLPFRKPWTGVLHHTADLLYDKNNIALIISSPEFMASLKYCQGLIVLSQYLKDWIQEKLPHIAIKVVYHPTEFVDMDHKWTIANWQANKDKKVVQIGAWLRDTFAIFSLPQPKSIRKCALKGKNMNNYYPAADFLDKFQKILTNQDFNGGICRHTTNKFLVGLYDQIKNDVNSVEIISTMDDATYDQLLISNIVFLKLIDASACNTIIECIIRNTPILVNRLPAVVEYLGKDYPLYYSTLEEAVEILNNENKIFAAYNYLSKKDKTFLKISTFIDGLL